MTILNSLECREQKLESPEQETSKGRNQAFPYPTHGLLKSLRAVRGHTPGVSGKREEFVTSSLLVPPTQGLSVLISPSGETSTQRHAQALPWGLHGSTHHPHLLPSPLGLLSRWPTRQSCLLFTWGHPASPTSQDTRHWVRTAPNVTCVALKHTEAQQGWSSSVSTTKERQKAQQAILNSAGLSWNDPVSWTSRGFTHTQVSTFLWILFSILRDICLFGTSKRPAAY